MCRNSRGSQTNKSKNGEGNKIKFDWGYSRDNKISKSETLLPRDSADLNKRNILHYAQRDT